MNEENKTQFPNVTHYTKVDVQPGGMNIQHVEHLHQADVLKALGIELEIKKDGTTLGYSQTANVGGARVNEVKEQLCSFIHPAIIDDAEKLKIHQEIKNLVCNFDVQNICSLLTTMAKEEKILLPPIDKALKEMHRLGMPGEETKGFSEKNFQHYYKK